MIVPLLASEAIAIISPLLIKGAEALTEGIGKDLWEGIKGVFKKNNKQAVLEKLEKEPKNEDVKEEVKFELATIMNSDPAAKDQVEKLVTNYKNNQAISQNISGTNTGNVIAGGNISGNTITTTNTTNNK